MVNLDRYILHKHALDYSLEKNIISFNDYKYVDTIKESEKKYLTRNLTIDYTNDNISKDDYLNKKKELDETPVSKDGNPINYYESKAVDLFPKRAKFSIPRNISMYGLDNTIDIINDEFRRYLSNDINNMLSDYERVVVDSSKDLYLHNKENILLHNFRFDPNIGIKLDLLPVDSYIMIKYKSHFIFDYNVYEEVSFSDYDTKMNLIYYLHIHNNNKKLCYLSKKLEESFYFQRL